jgi:hypothetical protein
MKQDHEDVKKRRHRRAISQNSDLSIANSSFAISDDEFDEIMDIAQPMFTFETDEISKMLYPPNTPSNGRRISAVDAFVLEKDKSTRTGSARKLSERGSKTPKPV